MGHWTRWEFWNEDIDNGNFFWIIKWRKVFDFYSFAFLSAERLGFHHTPSSHLENEKNN